MAKSKHKTTRGTSCKVCNHEHLLEIETALVVDKLPSREVAKMIDDNGWDSISYVTLLNHMKEHVDTKRELVLQYLNEKRLLLENNISVENDPEIDEMRVRLNELKRLDRSIQNADMLVTQSAKVLFEQLSLRIEPKETLKSGKTKDSRGNETNQKKSYTPIQRDVIQLYKSASEELRMTIKQKLDTLGIDSDSKKAGAFESLVDVILGQDEKE